MQMLQNELFFNNPKFIVASLSPAIYKLDVLCEFLFKGNPQ